MAVVTTGFFDGVHRGHREVLGALVDFAHKRGEESVVVTFWPHPRNVLQNDARSLRLLTSLQEKKEIIRSLGVDTVETVPFTREFSSLTAREYLQEWLVGKFGAKLLLLGYDNRLGRDCKGGQQIKEIADTLGLETVMLPAVNSFSDDAVSSTKIRAAVSQGRVKDACGMLGYDYFLSGVVVEGNRLGRTLGFPTANMQLYEPLKQLPGNGVYAVKVNTLGREYTGMCNVGVRPTIGRGNSKTIETNIFDFDEDIYGLDIRVSFLEKIRDEQQFGSLEQLKERLAEDKTRIYGNK